MERLIKDGDIILNGTKSRKEAEQEAFERLEDIEELLCDYEIDSYAELSKVLFIYWQARTLKERLNNENKIFEEWKQFCNGKSEDKK